MTKIVKAEIVRPRPSQRASLRAEIDRLVKQNVEEILARHADAALFEPDIFHDRLVHDEMARRNVFDRKKWALYFAQWGCRECKKTDQVHVGSAYCLHCYQVIRTRMIQLRKNWEAEHPAHPPELDQIDEKIRTAKRVFADGEP